MKKLAFLSLFIFMGLLLSACSFLTTVQTTVASTTTSTEQTTVETTITTNTTTISLTSATISSTSTTTELTTLPTTEVTTYSSIETTAPVTTTTETTTVSTSNLETIELYAMNDFHGGAYTDITMLSKIGAYLIDKNTSNAGTIILASGDMFQGTALSNYYYGLPIVESMNAIGFDAFTLGNHEFDWGIDKIANYKDGDPLNGEADFSVLAANIVNKATLEPLPWTVPYTIIDVNGIRVGIIGVIGDVINSISASRVEDVEFLDVYTTVSNYASILRTEEDCDIVVVSIHDYDYSVNAQIAALTEDHFVDAVFNGHTHSTLSDYISRSGLRMPYAQVSDSSSSLFSKITLVYDRSLAQVVQNNATIISESQLYFTNSDIDMILDVFATDTEYVAFVSEELATSQDDYYRGDLAPWGSSVIRNYMGLDFGMLNEGGFRTPMYSGTVTMGDLVVIYPFDNYIKTCYLTGSQLTAFYEIVDDHNYDVVFDDQVSYASGVLYKNGIAVGPDTLYLVGAVDYVFDKTNYAFLDGSDIQTTTFLIRDLLAEDLRNHDLNFNPANGTSFPGYIPTSYYHDYSELKKQLLMI